MFCIRKKFKFEMAHVLKSAYSKACMGVHGHSYILEVFFRSRNLNDDGMVCDFGEIKDHIKGFVEELDHAFIIPEGIENEAYWRELAALNKKTVWFNKNPTAEEMSMSFYYKIKDRMNDSEQLYKVRLHETDTGYAEYREEN